MIQSQSTYNTNYANTFGFNASVQENNHLASNLTIED